MSDDVKDLLSKAFGEEPPLGIDREEVLQQGRKRLRRRRFLEAGSVVALVVVVAVGAATLTNVVGTGQEERKLPPAASSTDHAPPGPDLPMTTPQMPKTTTHVPLTTDPVVMENQLTMLLYTSGVVDTKQVSPVPHQTGAPRFHQKADQFVYAADYVRSPLRRGYLEVVVDYSPNLVVDCGNLPGPSADCEVRNQAGVPVTLTRSIDAKGIRTVRATTVSAQGVGVSVAATNVTRQDLENGHLPAKTEVVLTDDEVCLLATKAGLGG